MATIETRDSHGDFLIWAKSQKLPVNSVGENSDGSPKFSNSITQASYEGWMACNRHIREGHSEIEIGAVRRAMLTVEAAANKPDMHKSFPILGADERWHNFAMFVRQAIKGENSATADDLEWIEGAIGWLDEREEFYSTQAGVAGRINSNKQIVQYFEMMSELHQSIAVELRRMKEVRK